MTVDTSVYFICENVSRGLNVVNETCLNSSQVWALRDQVYSQTMTYGTIMLIIGVGIGIIITVAYPRVYAWANKNIKRKGR
jgi:hypothetical protein